MMVLLLLICLLLPACATGSFDTGSGMALATVMSQSGQNYQQRLAIQNSLNWQQFYQMQQWNQMQQLNNNLMMRPVQALSADP